jgi:hypothetical protein
MRRVYYIAMMGLLGAAAASAAIPIVEGAGAASAGTPTFPSPSSQNAGLIATPILLGINDLVSESGAGIIGSVESVSAARWNSLSGEPWVQTSGSQWPALEYRDAQVKVNDVLFSDSTLPVTSGQLVTIRLIGDGTATGAPEPGGYPGETFNSSDGPVTPGSTRLMLLREAPFYFADGSSSMIVELSSGYQANWRVDGSQAASADPQRTVDLGALRQRIAAERAAGHRPEDPSMDTTRNPLGTPTTPTTAPPPPPPCYGQYCQQAGSSTSP